MASHRRPSHRLANRCARSDRPIRVRAQPGIQAVWVEQISRGFRRGAVFYRQTVVPVHHTGLPPGGRAHFPLVTLPKSLSLSCPQTRLGVISEQANMRSARCAGLSTLTVVGELRLHMVKRQSMLYVFQATALIWALAVCLRTVDLGWNPFAGIGLGLFGSIPISFLGIRIHSRQSTR